MTLEDLKNSSKTVLSTTDISGILKIHPSRITEYARKNMLPFPYFISGNRVKVPRIAFLNWMEGKTEKTS